MDIKDAIASGKFKAKNLTVAINNVNTPKLRIQELGLFEEKGIRQTSIDVAYKEGEVVLVQDVPRGEDGEPLKDNELETFTFKASHLPIPFKIMADDVQGKQAFGEEDNDGLEMLDDVIAEKQEAAVQSIDMTIEYQRLGAMMGKVISKSGAIIVNLFKKFGLKEADAKSTIDFNKPLHTEILNAKRDSEKHQKGAKASEYIGFCSPEFFNSMLEDSKFEKAYERQSGGTVLRSDVRMGIDYMGVFWEEMNVEFDGKKAIGEGKALLVPRNKPGLFRTFFSPANYNGTVNTIGLPYYSNSEPLGMDKGIQGEGQSNPINMCTSPLAVRLLDSVPKAAPSE